MTPIRPLNRPNPTAIARRKAITGAILDTLGAGLIGVLIVLVLFW